VSFYNFARAVVHVVAKIRYRLHFEGLENIPTEGGFILCSNHISMFDPILIAIRVKPQCFFMAKEELFRNKFVSALIRALGAFPVSRGKGDTAAIDRAIEIVRNRQVLAIFPEGHRSKDGKLLKLKSGAVVVASQTNADILPCIIKKGEKKGLRYSLTVRYGKMIRCEDLGITAAHAPSEIRTGNRILTECLTNLLEDTHA
jgi:1-acyl-sn-glycerol-3-phosphate acyltransferase